MSTRRAGRPPQFDRDAAVLEAARLFWRRGYSGTSTRALSAALSMSTSSIYAAFGSKAGLFEQAVRTYAERYRTIFRDACAEPSLADVARHALHRSIDEFTQPAAQHPGCLVSSAVMTDMPDAINTRAYLDELYAFNERMVRQRAERAQEDGLLSREVDPAALAASLLTLWHGLSARSNLGVTRAGLHSVADMLIPPIWE